MVGSARADLRKREGSYFGIVRTIMAAAEAAAAASKAVVESSGSSLGH